MMGCSTVSNAMALKNHWKHGKPAPQKTLQVSGHALFFLAQKSTKSMSLANLRHRLGMLGELSALAWCAEHCWIVQGCA